MKFYITVIKFTLACSLLLICFLKSSGQAQQKQLQKHTEVVNEARNIKMRAMQKEFHDRLKSKTTKDSLENVGYEKHRKDSLEALGIFIKPSVQPKQARTATTFNALSSTSLNLGFENGFTDWEATLTANLWELFLGKSTIKKQLTSTDGRVAMPDVTYPETTAAYPNGIPSKHDTQSWIAGPLTSQLPNQPARYLLIDKDENLLDYYGKFQITPDFVGNTVARIGNGTVGFFTDGGTGAPVYYPALYEQESLSYTFIVDAINPYIIVNFAVVLQDPSQGSNPHGGLNRTYFKVTAKKTDGSPNALLDCATYEVYANSSGSNIPGLLNSDVNFQYGNPLTPSKSTLYKPWSSTIVNLDAPELIGQQVTLTFSTGDCLSGGHFAYAYVDAYPVSSGIISKSNDVEKNVFCVGETVDFSSAFAGRYAGEFYLWDFGDLTSSDTKNPSHIYTTPGTYNIQLSLNTVAGNCIPIKKQITIQPPADPTFTYLPLKPAPGQSVTLTVTQTGNLNKVDWGDNTAISTLPANVGSHTYASSGTYTISVTSSAPSGNCIGTKKQAIDIAYLCSATLPTVAAAAGSFQMDRLTGNIVYVRSVCPVQALMPCVIGPAINTSKVVKADATVFSDQWLYDANIYNAENKTIDMGGGVFSGGCSGPLSSFPCNSNLFDNGQRGKWRVKSTYVHNTSLIPEEKNFKAGTFTLQNFNWKSEAANNKTKWLLGTEVTAYSPHGDALSEKNILGVESAAKFGYKNAVPYLTAKNANLSSVLFESFEMTYNGMLEDKMIVPKTGALDDMRTSSNIAHSGYYSWKLTNGGQFDLSEFKLSQDQLSKGLQVKLWIKLNTNNVDPTTNQLVSYKALLDNMTSTSPVFLVKVKGQYTDFRFKVVSRTGDWILCEANVTGFGTIKANEIFSLTLKYLPTELVWIDDIRVQPIDSEMSCYVYDKDNLRLLTVFDDQHFGLYYQYNGEGKLIRKMRETEKGIKTIQETQYNTTLIPR